jgi:hypothetical protein
MCLGWADPESGTAIAETRQGTISAVGWLVERADAELGYREIDGSEGVVVGSDEPVNEVVHGLPWEPVLGPWLVVYPNQVGRWNSLHLLASVFTDGHKAAGHQDAVVARPEVRHSVLFVDFRRIGWRSAPEAFFSGLLVGW